MALTNKTALLLTWWLEALLYSIVEQEFQASSKQLGAAHSVTAVDRSADLLVRVLESDAPVAVGELASATGIPKSTASRLLSALERRGLIEQDGARGRLRPGPAILRVAERGMLQRNLVELARPSLDPPGQLRGETINIGRARLQGDGH